MDNLSFISQKFKVIWICGHFHRISEGHMPGAQAIFLPNFLSAVRTRESSKCFQNCEKSQANGTAGAPATLPFTVYFCMS